MLRFVVSCSFIQVDIDTLSQEYDTSGSDSTIATCNLIYHILHALLLRLHAHSKRIRLTAPSYRMPPPALLQPIIDLLQYRGFCTRVRAEMDKVIRSLENAGIPASLRFITVGETGADLLKHFLEEPQDVRVGQLLQQGIGGEAVLRIDGA